MPVDGGFMNCLRFGTGPKQVVCFHGYGEDATHFEFLEDKAGQHFTFYSIDLPHHGQTEWPGTAPFTTATLGKLILEILPHDNPNFSILGFSLGGRVALSLYELFPGRVEKLVLLAPDGLKVNGWYWLATQTAAGNRFFAFTMRKPGWFLGALRLFNKLKPVNASIYKFVNYYIGEARIRELLYLRWTALRKIKPDLKKIKAEIHIHRTPTRLIYGRHDRIILFSVGEKFRKGAEEHVKLEIIESGHQVLHGKHADSILLALR